MTIEFMTDFLRHLPPRASINKSGTIIISTGAIRQFNITGREWLLLGYDSERKIVAIKLLSDWSKGARKICLRREQTGCIGAKTFFGRFNIPYSETKSYDLRNEDGLLIFNLTD